MDVLGDLSNLSSIFLDDWRPGAASIFDLTQLETVGIRRYPHSDLRPMQGWKKLVHLWLASGGLESLDGVSDNIATLELAELRKLSRVDQIARCHKLNRLIIQSCRGLTSLIGIESCRALEFLSIFRIGTLTSLQPIRCLPNLKYLVLTEFAGLLEPDETILDNMPQLETLIISKKLGIPAERLRHVLPNTNLRIVP